MSGKALAAQHDIRLFLADVDGALAAAKEALQLILQQGLDAWVYTEQEWLIRDASDAHQPHLSALESSRRAPFLVAGQGKRAILERLRGQGAG